MRTKIYDDDFIFSINDHYLSNYTVNYCTMMIFVPNFGLLSKINHYKISNV